LSFSTHTFGRFVLSPGAKPAPAGHFHGSLSIKSGQGSGSLDRLYRFTPSFATPQAAADYALAEGFKLLSPSSQEIDCPKKN
jgi:hypothetical protein